MRLRRLILPLALLLAPVLAVAQDVHPRSEIKLFRYRGAESGGQASNQFDVFRGILEDRIANFYWKLRQATSASAPAEDLDFFGQLSLSPPEADTFPNSNAVRQWIRSDPTILHVMRGTVFEQGGDFRFKTRSWFAAEPLADPEMFPLDMVFNQDGFANYRDTHSLVIFLAVAIEAKRIGIRHDLIAAVVSEALNSIADLERRNAMNVEDVQRLKVLWLEFKNAL